MWDRCILQLNRWYDRLFRRIGWGWDIPFRPGQKTYEVTAILGRYATPDERRGVGRIAGQGEHHSYTLGKKLYLVFYVVEKDLKHVLDGFEMLDILIGYASCGPLSLPPAPWAAKRPV